MGSEGRIKEGAAPSQTPQCKVDENGFFVAQAAWSPYLNL
jgi:hypothetical protein